MRTLSFPTLVVEEHNAQTPGELSRRLRRTRVRDRRRCQAKENDAKYSEA
jgi:hypothetical protein